MMTIEGRPIVREVSAKFGVPVSLLLGACRLPLVVQARIELSRRLRARGYSLKRIGQCLDKDHTTILFYLGTGKRRPSARCSQGLENEG